MAFWSAATLRDRLGDIVTDFDPNRVGRANYTLRMGDQAYVSPEGRVTDAKGRCLTPLEGCGTCTIPPGQFGFLLTEETVKVPFNAIAFISVRATYKYMGLVNVSGFHVDPGWEGPLIFAVFNGGPSPVTVKRHEKLFHIWFADLDVKAEDNGAKIPKDDGIGSSVINGLGDQLISMASLSKRVDDLASSHDNLAGLTMTKIALYVAILGALIAIAANLYIAGSSPNVFLDQRSDLMLPEKQPDEDSARGAIGTVNVDPNTPGQ